MADGKLPVQILKELKDHFIPQRHVLFERYKFNSAIQKDEPVRMNFLIRLRQLAESCEFGGLKESMIQDRLVIGTSDEKCHDHLLRERAVPDLNRCIELLKTCEISTSYKQAMAGTVEAPSINTWTRTRKQSLENGLDPTDHSQSLQDSPELLQISAYGVAKPTYMKEVPSKMSSMH